MSWLSSFDPHARSDSGGHEGSSSSVGGWAGSSSSARGRGFHASSGGHSGTSWQADRSSSSSARESRSATASSRNPAFIPRRYPNRREPPQPVAPKPPPTHAIVREEDLQVGESKYAEIRKRRPPGWSEAPPIVLPVKPFAAAKPTAPAKRKAVEPPSGPRSVRAAAAPRPAAAETALPPPTAPRSMRQAASTGSVSASGATSTTASQNMRQAASAGVSASPGAASPTAPRGMNPAPKASAPKRYFDSIPTAKLFSDDDATLRRIITLAPQNTLCTTRSQRAKLQTLDMGFCELQRQLQSKSARNLLLDEHDARRVEEKSKGKGKGAASASSTQSSPASKEKKKAEVASSSSRPLESAEKRRRLAAPNSDEGGSSGKQLSKSDGAGPPSTQPKKSSHPPVASSDGAGLSSPSKSQRPSHQEAPLSMHDAVRASVAMHDAAWHEKQRARANDQAAPPPGPPPKPPPGTAVSHAADEHAMSISSPEPQRPEQAAKQQDLTLPAQLSTAPPVKRRFIETSPAPQDWDESIEMEQSTEPAQKSPPRPAEEQPPTSPSPSGPKNRTARPDPPPAGSSKAADRGKSHLFDHDEDEEMQAPSATANGIHGGGRAPHRPDRAAFEELFEPASTRDADKRHEASNGQQSCGTAPAPREPLTAAQYTAWQQSHLRMMDTSSSGGDESDLDDGSVSTAPVRAGASTSLDSESLRVKAEAGLAPQMLSSPRRAESARPRPRSRSRTSSANSDASDVPLANIRHRNTRSAGPDAGKSRSNGSASLQVLSAAAPRGHSTADEDPSGYNYDSDEPLAARRQGVAQRSTRSVSATASASTSRPKYSVTIQSEGMHMLGIRGSFLCPIATEMGQRGILSTSRYGRLALLSPITRADDGDAVQPLPPDLTMARLSTTNVTDAVRLSSKVVGIASRSNVAVGPRMPQMALVFAKDGGGMAANESSSSAKAGSDSVASLDVMELRPAPHLGGVSALSPLSGGSSEVCFITGGVDGVVERWTLGEKRTTTQQIHCLHEREVTAIAAMPRHSTVVSSTEGKVLGFDFEHLKTAFSWSTTDRISTLQQTHHPDLVVGTVLRSDFDQVKFWDIREPIKVIARPVLRAGWAATTSPSDLGRVAFHPTKGGLFAIGSDDGRMRIFDIRKMKSHILLDVTLGESNVGGVLWDAEDRLCALETTRVHRFEARVENVEG